MAKLLMGAPTTHHRANRFYHARLAGRLSGRALGSRPLRLHHQNRLGLVLGHSRSHDPNSGWLLSDDTGCQHWLAYANHFGIPDCIRLVVRDAPHRRGGSKIIGLAFVSGLAYMLTFIDGVGAISRFQTESEGFVNGMYAMSEKVNWWGAAAWAIFIFTLVKRKLWTIPLGVFAAVMSMFGGYPVRLTDVIAVKGGFSMFLVAPIISTGLLIYLLLPGTKKMITEWQNK
jgi:hypothetical protein